MKKKSILFPSDFSSPSRFAFIQALKIADELNATIHLLHVVPPEVEALDVPIISEKATRHKVEAASEIMDSFIGYGKSQAQNNRYVKIEKSVEIGFPSKVIRLQARKKNVDLIIIACRGEHGAFDKLFGSVSSAVVKNAECPVLLIPEDSKIKELSSILYATDYQETDPFHIMRMTQLLKPLSTIIRCVHFKKFSKKEKKPIEMNALREVFLEHLPTVQMTFHEWEGESLMQALLEFADIYEIDIIAMLVQKRSFLDEFFHRSATKNLSLNSNMPILVLHEH